MVLSQEIGLVMMVTTEQVGHGWSGVNGLDMAEQFCHG